MAPTLTYDIDPRLAETKRVKFAAAQSIAEKFLSDDAVDCVYLAGSLAAGLGSSFSDVDMFVISGEVHKPRMEQFTAERQRVDVEFRPRGWMRGLASEVTFDATTRDTSTVLRSKVPYDLTVRLLLSEPLKTCDEYVDAVALLTERDNDLRRLIMARYAQMSYGALEDTLGFLRDGDTASAEMTSRDLLLFALQTFTVGCGDLYLGQKWILRKLARSAGPHFPLDSVEGLLQDVRHDTRQRVLDRLAFAQSALCAALVRGWDAPLADEWRDWGLGSAGPRRNPEWFPHRLTDGVILAHLSERLMKVTPPALEVWGWLGGEAPLDRLLERIEDGTERAAAAHLVHTLIERGIVHDGPQVG